MKEGDTNLTLLEKEKKKVKEGEIERISSRTKPKRYKLAKQVLKHQKQDVGKKIMKEGLTCKPRCTLLKKKKSKTREANKIGMQTSKVEETMHS